MAEYTKLWKIDKNNEKLIEIPKAKLNFEKRLEIWIEDDIKIISKDLMTIGRQVVTDYGGIIDILCIEENGDLVIIELKRDKTPREITAQILDYASWISDLSNDDIKIIADNYYKTASLEEKYKNFFSHQIPEIINENHKMLIVGASIDSDSERIIKYLSENYGVNINAITFTYYKDEQAEYLSRNFLIEPEKVNYNQSIKNKTKRTPPPTIEEYLTIGKEREIFELLKFAIENLKNRFDSCITTLSTISFIGIMEGHRSTILNLEPMESNKEDGLKFYIYIERFKKYFNVTEEEVEKIFNNNIIPDTKWNEKEKILRGYIKEKNIIEKIIAR
jgi:hypothetical protein